MNDDETTMNDDETTMNDDETTTIAGLEHKGSPLIDGLPFVEPTHGVVDSYDMTPFASPVR